MSQSIRVDIIKVKPEIDAELKTLDKSPQATIKLPWQTLTGLQRIQLFSYRHNEPELQGITVVLEPVENGEQSTVYAAETGEYLGTVTSDETGWIY